MVPETDFTLEYWMTLTMEPIPGDDEPSSYRREIQRYWMAKMWEYVPKVVQGMEARGELVTKMRYLYNGLILKVDFVFCSYRT
jgi:hypothetical protein